MDLERYLKPYNPPTTTLIDCLQYWTEKRHGDLAYMFTDGEAAESSFTFGQFGDRVRAIARRLAEEKLAGERILLLYPPGIEYVAAYFGCLAAGAVAVPAYPPRRNRNMLRIAAIAEDAQAKAALVTSDVQDRKGDALDEAPLLKQLLWIATDEIPSDSHSGWQPGKVDPKQLAMLQYTSGSTGTPAIRKVVATSGTAATIGSIWARLRVVQSMVAPSGPRTEARM